MCVGVSRHSETNYKTEEITNSNLLHINNVIYLNTHPILIHILWGTFSNPVFSTEIIHTPKGTLQLDPPSSDVSLHIAHILFIQFWKAKNYHKLSGLKTLQWNTNTKTVINLQGIQWLVWKLSCTITPGSMSLLKCEIHQRGRVSRVGDTELILLIVYLNPTTGFNCWCRMS